MSRSSNAVSVTRRTFLGATSVLAMMAMASGTLAQDQTIKIGYVTPQSGPLAAFAEADAFVLKQVNDLLGGSIETANGPVKFEVIVRDSHPTPTVPRKLRVN